MKTETREKPLECERCHWVERTEALSDPHTNVVTWLCEDCWDKFSSKPWTEDSGPTYELEVIDRPDLDEAGFVSPGLVDAAIAYNEKFPGELKGFSVTDYDTHKEAKVLPPRVSRETLSSPFPQFQIEGEQQ